MKIKGAMPHVGQAAVSNPPDNSASSILSVLLMTMKILRKSTKNRVLAFRFSNISTNASFFSIL